ncbi:helix-turn-helix domain-containing protein [Imbroritus primus]|uniref:Helix-turn-helix domain-containing protein n=1 Tax=Imbroritus primus TaxID=3058603 RepID=A0ACD3SRM6_9BURK|nr:helix-turn-helix domain-containing protein [Burkholderiaceae bacterium PBA]
MSSSVLSRFLQEGRDLLTNNEAAVVLAMKPQSLRRWACYECGPIQPIRIGGRLRWRVSDVEFLINGEA